MQGEDQINPSTFPRLKPGVCSGLNLSGAFDPVLKDGVRRRRSIKEVGEGTKRERRYEKKRGHFCPRNH